MQRIIILYIVCNSFLCLKLKAQECNCRTNLDSLIRGIETNYVGFSVKVKNEDVLIYNRLIRELKMKSDTAGRYECHLLLTEYANYFKDPHLRIQIAKLESTNKYQDSLKIMFRSFPTSSYNLDSILEYYNTHTANHTLEGIWYLPEFNYKVAIVKSRKNNLYEGIILTADNFRWYKGQIKMIASGKNPYKIQFYIADHTQRLITGTVKNNVMNLGEYGVWRKEQKGKVTNLISKEVISYKSLSKKTALIKIGSASINLRDSLNSIIGKKWPEIVHKDYLIIDIRDNTGGAIMTFDTLLRLHYKGPIHTDGLYLKASPDNISLYEEALTNPQFNDQEKKNFQNTIDSLKVHPGTITLVSDIDSIVLDGTIYPKKIAIVINSRTASAAELFAIQAKQSSKVTLVGEHTKGALDFSELGRNRNLPCPIWQYTCPMGMGSHKYYPFIDNIGIQPDNIIPDGVDWIKWTQNFLENGN